MEKRETKFGFTSFILLASMILIFYFQIEEKINSVSFFIFQYCWLVLPHILSFIFIRFSKFKRPIERTYWCVAAIVMSIAGLIFIADCIFWHSDAQGGIAILMTPIFQFIILGVFALIM